MNIKCPHCAATLEYSTNDRMMTCKYCDSSFTMEEVNKFTSWNSENDAAKQPEEKPAGAIINGGIYGDGFGSDQIGDYNTLVARKEKEKEKNEARRHATTKMNIMKCTSCGAELAVNSTESSTFCAYCGQATVVLDRVDDYLQPDYIMPFKIPKEDAERAIRAKLSEGFFIPKEIKNFELDKLRGIYVPFWLYDADFNDYEVWKHKVKQGKSTVTRYSIREGNCKFTNLTQDSSLNLNDNSSQRLEPYDMRQLIEFDPSYLSGFYSDRFDLGTEKADFLAKARMHELFTDEAAKTIKHSDKTLVYSRPVMSNPKTKYALLPVWFLTFRQENKPYTMLVNGQTGKIVGAVPFDKKKASAFFVGVLAVLLAIAVPLFATLTNYIAILDGGEFEKLTIAYFVGIPLLIFALARRAYKSYQAMKLSMELTNSDITNKYVKERQDS